MADQEFPLLHEALMRHTGFLLGRLGMVAQKRFSERLEALELTLRMWGALNVLAAEGAITQHALCRSIGSDPSSMVATIDELEAKGLVERRRHPTDRRAYALRVTPDGDEMLARGRKLAMRAQDDLLAPLSPEEREQLHSLLYRLAAQTDEDRVGAEPPVPATAPVTGAQATTVASASGSAA